ncbi:MAG TPA: threonine/serine dehydratase [Ktedonobacteraceae bacterium]|nr:threonine/serine dehydratase [Ktedonobacteraceae bacterium]
MRTEIKDAHERIAGYVRTTPIMHLEAGAWGLDAHVVLKLEQLQHTGSFKPRGAFNRILSHEVPEVGVIAASGGNHGVAVAYAARQLGYRAEIFVPEVCPPVKVQRLGDYGAQVYLVGATYAEALLASQARAVETGALVIHAYDQPEVVAGQGTLGCEFARQVPNLDTVLVAVGGGGLIAGVAAWFEGNVRVIGVEPISAASMAAALQAGEPVDFNVGGVAADSLGARRVGTLAFDYVKRYVDRVVVVQDESIRAAQRVLWNDLRLVAEPGGATAAAALISGAYQPAPGERVGVVICGGNTDPGQVV